MLINKIEELSMNAWPSIQTKLYDGWVLRFSDGYTKRANSINPIYESTIKLDEKIDFCEKQYSLLDLARLQGCKVLYRWGLKFSFNPRCCFNTSLQPHLLKS